MKYGLLGRHLGHSYSPSIHHMLGNPSYTLFEQEPESLADFFADPSLTGLNVTIPYKADALKACHSLTDRAQRIGAVNTMIRQADGSWHGDNTDYDGCLYSFTLAGIDPKDKQCLILGDGATSQTVHVVLEDLGAKQIIHISRKRAPFYEDLPLFYDTADIIINATPVGMYPNCPESLIDLSLFKKVSGVLDLVYNPVRTSLLLQAQELGISYSNGLAFLVAQAVESAKRFQEAHNMALDSDKAFNHASTKTSTTDETANALNPADSAESLQTGKETASLITDIMAAIQKNHENIVLVGMPGVGKTTVGKALAEATGRQFVDLDDELAKDIGSIPDFIQTHGEAAFRREESKVVERFGKQSSLIISTGGGAVTVPANFAPLRQNGRIYQITQPVDKLATNGRPLSSGGLDRLKELERIRKPMYEAFAQCVIEHHKNAPQTVEKILNDFYANLGR